MNSAAILNITGLSFAYTDGPRVLRDISLEVRRGEIVGLVGPNGSGKSTLIKLVFDLLQLREGTIEISGAPHHSKQGRQQAQYLASNDHLPSFLKATEYLRLICDLYQIDFEQKQVENWFKQYSMAGRATHLIEDFSHGMRKKTQLISAMLARRPLLIIDETLNGIDIEALLLVEQELLRLRDAGTGILLCSHDFSMLQRIADRIVFLDYGHIVEDLTVSQLNEQSRDLAQLVMDHLAERVSK